jgi:hypothetical protein
MKDVYRGQVKHFACRAKNPPIRRIITLEVPNAIYPLLSTVFRGDDA